MNKIYITVIIITVSLCCILGYRNNKLNSLYKTSENNNKAYSYALDSIKNNEVQFKFTIEQLNYFNDSIIDKLKETKKELKIKDKKLRSMQYILSTTTKVDSIYLKDTIFIKDLTIDTTIGDRWYSTNLILNYPNKIIVRPEFINEYQIFLTDKKETINPPKKFFLLRWFQKKHTLVTVIIEDKNPYSKIKKQKFIEIIK